MSYKEDLSKQLYEVQGSSLKLKFHAGQQRAWDSQKNTVCLLSGRQSGKSSFLIIWLLREISRRGPGEYLVAAPTFPLLSLKLLPELLKLYKTHCRLGTMTTAGSYRSRFVFSSTGCKSMFGKDDGTGCTIFFGYAENPDSLESMTVKAAIADEAGQDSFRLQSYEAIRGRLSINDGRLLIGTTPYSGAGSWIKDIIYDPWKKCKDAGTEHPWIDVIQFKSIENPAFSMDVYLRNRETMPGWRFRMFYDGEFEKPAGMIYADFDAARHVCAPFEIPADWPRYLGLDFGGVHTAGVYAAKGRRFGIDDKDKYFIYREYPERAQWASSTAARHVEKMLAGEPRKPKAVGGAASENQWRGEFRAAGLYVYEPPVKGADSVEVGIDRVTEMLKNDEIVIFDHCYGLRNDIQNYSRELDERGEPTEAIANKKDYHFCDSLRYVCTYLKGKKSELWVIA